MAVSLCHRHFGTSTSGIFPMYEGLTQDVSWGVRAGEMKNPMTLAAVFSFIIIVAICGFCRSHNFGCLVLLMNTVSVSVTALDGVFSFKTKC